MKMLTKAEMMAPLESIMQMAFTMSMVDTAATPMVAQKNTSAEVRMEVSAEVAARWMASSLSWPFCSSSWNRVVIKMA